MTFNISKLRNDESFSLVSEWLHPVVPQVLTVYMSGVIAGSLGTSLSDPGTFLAGASGGVYALIAAHLATMLLNFREDNNIRVRKVTRNINSVRS